MAQGGAAIFDELRKQKRDALVARILATHPAGFERPEQLFEWFLVDPGMEPVVQTSRIQLAIASVQTFIQRCLLNLETKVHPASLSAEQWQWMKRYRVWEANRKIFLFPENWLEPELRDDKTDLFQELEAALLEGDVTPDLVEDAFYNYLTKLEERARLEIVGTYAEEETLDGGPALHVIARTYTQPRRYFYRRFDGVEWTAWDPITVEIESDHVVPVVWRDRLHVFWVTFLEKAEEPDLGEESPSRAPPVRVGRPGVPSVVVRPPRSKDLESYARSTQPSTLRKKKVSVQLHFTEHFQGAWQARRSSDHSPDVPVDNDFDRKLVAIYVSKEGSDIDEGALGINLGGHLAHSFRVVSRNGLPEFRSSLDPRADLPYPRHGARAGHFPGHGPLAVELPDPLDSTDFVYEVLPEQDILGEPREHTLVVPSRPIQGVDPDVGSLIAPFFYQDDEHTFFVVPTLEEQTLEEVDGYSIVAKPWGDVFKTELRPAHPLPPWPGPEPVELALHDTALHQVERSLPILPGPNLNLNGRPISRRMP